MDISVLHFLFPGEIVFGDNAATSVGDHVRGRGYRKPLVVTDKGIVAAGLLAPLVAGFDTNALDYVIFDDVVANPTLDNVADGLAVFRHANCDVLVAVGGGSAMDAAKAIACQHTNPQPLRRYVGYDMFSFSPAPLICVPTTAGTGSEVTRWAVVTDEEQQTKLAFGGKALIPQLSVIDPLLTISMPPAVTAQTGMDAFTHALEAYTATNSSPISDSFALQALRLIARWLPVAYRDGSDVLARRNMMYGQMLAGLAFSNAAVGTVHAMAHQLGALRQVPHGLANAVLLPYVMRFNECACEARFEDVLRLMSPLSAGSRSLIQNVIEMRSMLGIPHSLDDLGISESDLPTLADMATVDLANTFNARPVTRRDLVDLYQMAFAGQV